MVMTNIDLSLVVLAGPDGVGHHRTVRTTEGWLHTVDSYGDITIPFVSLDLTRSYTFEFDFEPTGNYDTDLNGTGYNGIQAYSQSGLIPPTIVTEADFDEATDNSDWNYLGDVGGVDASLGFDPVTGYVDRTHLADHQETLTLRIGPGGPSDFTWTERTNPGGAYNGWGVNPDETRVTFETDGFVTISAIRWDGDDSTVTTFTLAPPARLSGRGDGVFDGRLGGPRRMDTEPTSQRSGIGVHPGPPGSYY